jgi:hypothetical protein
MKHLIPYTLIAPCILAWEVALATSQAETCSALIRLRDPTTFQQWQAHKHYSAQQVGAFEEWGWDLKQQRQQLGAEDLWALPDWTLIQGRVASGLTLAADRVLNAAAYVNPAAAKIDSSYGAATSFVEVVETGNLDAEQLADRLLFEQTPVGHEVLSAVRLAKSIAAATDPGSNRSQLKTQVEAQLDRLEKQYQYAAKNAAQHKTLFANYESIREVIDSTCGAPKNIPKPPGGLTVQ